MSENTTTDVGQEISDIGIPSGYGSSVLVAKEPVVPFVIEGNVRDQNDCPTRHSSHYFDGGRFGTNVDRGVVVRSVGSFEGFGWVVGFGSHFESLRLFGVL